MGQVAKPGASSLVKTGAVVGAAVLLAALIALTLQPPPANVALFSPASGILVAALMRTRGQERAAALAGAAIAYAIANLVYGRTPAVAAIFVAGDTIEAIVIAIVLDRRGRRFELDTLESVWWFAGVSAAVIAVAGALVGAGLTLMQHSSSWVQVWQVWLLSDLASVMTVAPAILLVYSGPSTSLRLPTADDLVSISVIATASFVLVGIGQPDTLSLAAAITVLFPLFVWHAARGTLVAGALSLLAIKIAVVWHTLSGMGLFAGDEAAAHLFLLAIGFSVLTTGAIFSEHRMALDTSQRTAGHLARLEGSHRLALAAAKAGTFDWNVDADRVVWSPEHYAILGLVATDEPPTYETYLSRIHPDDRERLEAEVRRLLAPEGDGNLTAEYRILRADDGRERWVRSMARVEITPAGKVHRMSGLMMDITDERRIQEELRSSEERYRATFELAPVGIATIDLEGRWLNFNEEVCRITGFAPEELRSMSLSDLTHPDDIGSDWAGTRRLIEGAIPRYTAEKRYRHKSGALLWVSLNASLLRDGRGRPFQLLAVIENITARKQADIELRESALRLRIALESARAGIHVWHIDTGEIEWDDVVRAHWGLPPGAKVDFNVFASAIPAEDRLRMQEALAKALDFEGSGDYAVEHRVQGADGVMRWISAAGKVEFADGKPVRLVGITRDISERKEREQHIRVLMGEVSHRSKNLLAVAQAVARQTAANATSVEEFERRFSARLRSLSVSQDLLIAQDWRGVTLSTLVSTQLGHYADLVGTRIALDISDILVGPAAAQSLGMAIHELSTNAAKHGALSSDKGRVMVKGHIEDGPDGRRYVLSWEENGGPPVSAPDRTGFGQTVIEHMLGQRLGGDVVLIYAPEGLRWRLSAPLGTLIGAVADGSEARDAAQLS